LQYAARDAAVLIPLREKLFERIMALGLKDCAKLEFDCVMPVVDIELTGFYMNKHRWLEQLAIVEERRGELANELQEMLGEGAAQASLFGPPRANINLDSQQQVTEALTRLGIPLPDSTRNWKLQPLALQYPVVAKLLEYRTMQKALTSYGQNMVELINPKTGRLHADFRQIGAPTGRFACTNPNIQQVPHAAEYRRCFTGYPEGRQLIIADYSQIELRILAEFSGDEAFTNAFKSGADLHRVTAAKCSGSPGTSHEGATRLRETSKLWRCVRHWRAEVFDDDRAWSAGSGKTSCGATSRPTAASILICENRRIAPSMKGGAHRFGPSGSLQL